jgi:hypothetical protein
MKEDDEGIRFHTLLTAGMHHGGGSPVHGGGLQGTRVVQEEGAALGKARRAWGDGIWWCADSADGYSVRT